MTTSPRLTATLAVVAEPRRQEILRLVWDTERSAGDIAGRFDISFSAVSQHLRVLHDAGLVRVRRDGRRRLYSARSESLGPLRDVLTSMWSEELTDLEGLGERRERAGGAHEE